MSSITLTNKVFVRSSRAKSTTLERSRVAQLLDKFVFASLLVLIVLVAIPYGTVEPWWISLYECTVFGLAAVWVIEGLITGSWCLTEKLLLAPFAALILFAFFQTLALPGLSGAVSLNSGTISADPFETRLVALKLFAFAINGALLMRYTSNTPRLWALIHAMIGIAVVSALFGKVRYAMQQSEVGFGLPYLRRGSGFAQFVNKNHFAFLMELVIGLTAGLIIGGAVRRQRLLLYISAAVLMWTALVMTISRGGILSMLAQISFIFGGWIWLRSKGEAISRLRPTITGVVVTISIVAVVAVSAIWVGGDVLVTRMESLPTEVNNKVKPYEGVRRREVWGATWNLIKAHPIVGSGFGAYGIAITQFHQASGQWVPEAAHNDYLELLASGGAVGVGLIAWVAIVFIRRARRQISSVDSFRRAACLGALTGIFGILIHNVVDFGLHVTANAAVFIALVVIATREIGERA
jgi:O-antigen ligase